MILFQKGACSSVAEGREGRGPEAVAVMQEGNETARLEGPDARPLGRRPRSLRARCETPGETAAGLDSRPPGRRLQGRTRPGHFRPPHFTSSL